MKISILGLGWIGDPLYHLLADNGYQVIGTTTKLEKRANLRAMGVDARLLAFMPEPQGEDFEDLFSTDVLYINIPPARRTRSDEFHPRQLQFIQGLISGGQVRRVIYVSSTSVYPDLNQVAKEDDLLTLDITGNPVLFRAEQMMREQLGKDLTIVRFGGLLGDERVPGRYFSGRSNVVGHAPANYVYRSDAVKAIAWIIQNGLRGQTYNVTAPMHPPKREVYEVNAKKLGINPPLSYGNQDEKWKQVSSEKFIDTGFTFDYPDPRDFPYRL